jgi:hypothetical protein
MAEIFSSPPFKWLAPQLVLALDAYNDQSGRQAEIVKQSPLDSPLGKQISTFVTQYQH